MIALWGNVLFGLMAQRVIFTCVGILIGMAIVYFVDWWMWRMGR